MKAGFLQFTPELCNLDLTMERLKAMLERAPAADLIVLPELSNSGYNFPSAEHAFNSSENVSDSRFLKMLGDYCRSKKCFIATGFNERDGNKLYNSTVLLGPDGIVGKYRKIHLFYNEKDFFVPGDVGLPVFETAIGKIGMLVCFDWIFPEVWRILALKGADVICHCSALVLPGFAQRAVPIHALVNHVYVITANRTGTENNLTFTGMSTIAGPKGDVIYQTTADAQECRVFDFDLAVARNKMITPRNDLMADRRPDVYQELLSL